MDELDEHRLSFEADNTGLAKHLVDTHDVLVPEDRIGSGAGTWEMLDILHKDAHRDG